MITNYSDSTPQLGTLHSIHGAHKCGLDDLIWFINAIEIVRKICSIDLSSRSLPVTSPPLDSPISIAKAAFRSLISILLYFP